MIKKFDNEYDSPKYKLSNYEINTNSIVMKTKQYEKRKQSLETTYRQSFNSNQNSKIHNKNETKPIPYKNYTKQIEYNNKLSIDNFQILLKHIYKLKKCYEFVTKTKLTLNSENNPTEIDVEKIWDFLDKLCKLLNKFSKNSTGFLLSDFFDSLFNHSESHLKTDKEICLETILELLRSNDVELKSRKQLNRKHHTEEIVFIKKSNSKIHDKYKINEKPRISKPISVSLVDMFNKETIQSFIAVNRNIIESPSLITHQIPNLHKAFLNNIPSSTPELCKIEANQMILSKENSNPLNLFNLVLNDNSSQIANLQNNSSSILDMISDETSKSKDDIHKIYSYLKSIENLTRNIPKQLLKKILDINTFSLYPSSIII